MLTVLQSWLDIWGVRAAPLIVFGVAMTYPQWTVAIRERFGIRDERTLWFGTNTGSCWRARTSHPYHPEPEVLKAGEARCSQAE